MKYANTILDLIGNTPMVKINHLNPNPQVTILAKLESFNPGGSIKDRIGKSMIEGAEQAGKLKKGQLIIEATSGNTGIGLAMAAAVKGYKSMFTMPDWMSQDKEKILKAFGAAVIRTPTAVPINDPKSYKATAKRLAHEQNGFLPDQYKNPDNPKAHYEGTGPEIWQDTEGKVNYIVLGLGTGGTATGTVKYLKEQNAKIKFIAPDPVGSIYSGTLGPFLVEGIGHIFIPENVHLDMVDQFIRLESHQAITMAQDLTKYEGILAGPSSGAAMYAASEVAKTAKPGSVIVALFPDSGERYLDYLYDEDFEVPLPQKHQTKTGFGTKLLHAHSKDFAEKRGVVPSINRSATYTFANVDEAAAIFAGSNNVKDNRSKYVYARGNHPNQRQLELLVTKLEQGTDAVAFSSGMAAITAFAQTILSQGDHVVASNVLYGDSFHLFGKLVKKWGVNTTFIDITNLDQVKNAINQNTKMIFTETPTNPLLTIADIEALSQITTKSHVLLAVDNTFASPYLQQPLVLGADVVIESTTKYLSGHSDALGGIVVAKDQNLIMDLWGTLFVTGAVMDPQSAWLTLRGLKTLALRMEKHNSNALAVAKYLSRHPQVKIVHYPGLLSHPQHDLARTQMNGFGGVLSFEIKGGVETGKQLVNNLELFSLSVSIGAIESLVNHPASMTHKVVPQKERLKAGITDGLIRISIGIEDVDDLIADLNQALHKISL